MRTYICIFVCLLMCRPAVSAQPSDRPLIQMTKEQLLNELDWILVNKNIFEDKKKEKLELLKSD